MNKRFTPWPWEVLPFRGSVKAVNDPLDWVCCLQVSNTPNWEANARLIAAAPCMFELLEKIANDPYGYDHEDILPLLTKITTP